MANSSLGPGDLDVVRREEGRLSTGRYLIALVSAHIEHVSVTGFLR